MHCSLSSRPLHITNFTQDDGDDDVTIGWYVDNAHLPIETHIPTYCNVIVSVVLRKVRNYSLVCCGWNVA